MTDLPLARKMWRTLEPYHALTYFTPCTAAYEALGLRPRAQYFAARSAPLGAVPAEVAIATFYNFHPDVVRAALPGAWETTTPAAAVDARLQVADAGLRAVLGDDHVKDPTVAEAAGLARVAADAATDSLGGRALFAAHASLPWPDEPHLALWHAISLLREHRGDGHVAALVVEGLDPCEALVSHAGAGGSLFTSAALQGTRGWSDDEWRAATDRLRDRGLVDDAGAVTAAGAALRARVEERTDVAAAPPWAALGGERGDRLRGLVRPFSRRIADSGVLGSNPGG